MTRLSTVEEVVARLREIDESLPPDDGVAVFNRMYLTVTEQIHALLTDPGADPVFEDPETLAELDVRFADLWLHAYDAAADGRRIPSAWAPLFEARRGGRLPVQYAVAGMNTHIEHDLPLAVVRTCAARGLEPDRVHRDYEAVNGVLARVESGIRRSFLDELGQRADDHLGPVVHVLSSWNIDKARDVAWVTAETVWRLRETEFLLGRFLTALGHTVGMGTRVLLTPVPVL